jgi:phosphate transport system substrate-binding protein
MKKIVVFIMVSAVIYSCGNSNNKNVPVVNSNKIKVAVDESLRPIFEAEEVVFEAINTEKNIDFIYTNESDAMQLVLMDSCKLAIIPRKANAAEQKVIDADSYKFIQSKVAIDALAFITNKANPDTIYTVDQIRKLMDGTATEWKQIFSSNKSGKIQVVFDNPKSGAQQYFKDSLLNGQDLAKHCFALNTNPEVIDYVEKNKNAIGIIGLNWISDKDDSKMKGFLNKINVAEIIPKKITYESLTYKPIQANVAIRQYPFCREIYVYGRQTTISLSNDFANFLMGDQGQRIILKSGLVPAKAPIRILQIKK